LEEVGDFPQEVGRNIVQILHPVPLGIAHRHTQDLLIGPFFVPHLKHTYRFYSDVTAGKGSLTHQDQRIEGVAVFRQGAGEKAVVGRIMDGREEHPIQEKTARFRVIFVFVAAAAGNFHYYYEAHTFPPVDAVTAV